MTVEIDLDAPPAGTSDAYLRLHLLSHLLVRPERGEPRRHLRAPARPSSGRTPARCIRPTSHRLRPALQRAGIHATGLDKFPRLLDYVTPERVRIADASRVRLGAHLAPGTTVMHEGFVNFNAGTLGTSMVEGRVSQGVVVGDGTDIGGGASIMGTLSGGGTQRVAIGERALLGANSGIGISIGDDSVVEAGLYVTAGTKVVVVGARGRGRPHREGRRALGRARTCCSAATRSTGGRGALPHRRRRRPERRPARLTPPPAPSISSGVLRPPVGGRRHALHEGVTWVPTHRAPAGTPASGS